jgi:murein L,D-transpeptidase YcbB/YkuD
MVSTWRRAAVILTLILLLGAGRATGQDSVSGRIRGMIAQARHPWARRPDFPRDVDVLARLYGSRGDSPVWLDGGGLSPAGRTAVAELVAAAEQGLAPADYDAATLEGLARGLPHRSWNAVALARFDLLLSLDVIRYLDDLRGGRVRPGPFGQGRAPPALDLARCLARAIAANSVRQLAASLQPAFAQYRNLRLHLVRYQRLAAAGPFVPLPAGTVRPGDAFAALEGLRARLADLGDLPPNAAVEAPDSATQYRGAVVEAVRRFQARHDLAPDGVLGRSTLAALNVPYALRARQIALAMERLRALPALTGHRFIVVNIPAFRLFAFDSVGGSGAPTLQMKVVTGKALDTRTPVLFEEVRYVEFRPYWNVPRSILVKELLPLVRRRPGYLRAHQMEVVDARQTVVGDVVTSAILGGLTRGELRVRQRPGPANALGLAKFVFPNAANIYMHGTPDTVLFARSRRDFSHGCIRLENPAGLADWVLGDQAAWNREAIEAAMTNPRTTRALLRRPVPVLMFYTTAVAFPDGSVHFYPDVYRHDRALIEALRAIGEPG